MDYSRKSCVSTAGVLAMATLMSVAVLASAPCVASAAGMGGQTGSNGCTSGESRVVLRSASNDEDTLGWIDCLTQAAKSLRGKAQLPERLASGVVLGPSAVCPAVGGLVATSQLRDDRLPDARPSLACHLIDLPPPSCV